MSSFGTLTRLTKSLPSGLLVIGGTRSVRSSRDSASEPPDETTYARWKGQSVIPFRYSFTGLAILGVAGSVKGRDVWETHYWPVALVFAVLFFAGTVSLFLDIPRRRLSPFSQAFLGLGVVVLVGLMGIGILTK